MTTAGRGTHLALALALVGLVCVAGVLLPGRDPTVVLEVVVGGVSAAWALVGLRNLIRARRLATALDAHATEAAIGGVTCRIVPGGGRHAFVLGVLRPRIYVGDRLPAEFDPDELRAVLFHEDHHRRTRAPLRAAALEAWLAIFGRVARVRLAIQTRLGDLEALADRHAVANGVSPASLASALVKADPSPGRGASSFASASERRLRHLLALADGSRERVETLPLAAPYEWLPLAAGITALVACHVIGLPFS